MRLSAPAAKSDGSSRAGGVDVVPVTIPPAAHFPRIHRNSAMTELSQAKGPSFLQFAREHTFVAVFGVIVPLAVFAIFVGYPIVYTVYLSFFDWNGMTPTKAFVGLDNYRYLIGDKYFYIALTNNAK